MPNLPNIRRNIAESAENIYINRWWTGEITQRSPLFTPISALGLQIIARHDTLYSGGSNMELSPDMTLVRRYGHSKYCTVAFGASDWPLAFFSFKNIAGTIKLLVDTPTTVVNFTTSAQTSLYTKGTTAQSSFAKVGNEVYICDGTNLKKWDQTTVRTWGITAPVTAPSLTFASGSLSPTVGYKYIYVYKCSTTGHISTASPASASTGPQTSKQISVSYTASADSQVDKIDIYRTVDGGGIYYYLTEVTNATSSYTDNNADSALNTALIAPLSGINDPPPAGMDLVTWHNDRLFGAVNNLLYFSSGPDATNGVQAECWNPSYVFTLPSKITALASTSNGLLIFTADDIFVCLGTDTVSYYVIPWQRNYGVLTQNCVVQDGDTVYFYTSKSQLWSVDASGLQEIGFAIGDQLLSTFAPASSYLALHRNGTDVGLFISDGSANLKRFAVSSMFQAWCPTGAITGGIGAISSIETSVGTWSLLVGRPTASGYILQRDTSLYMDDGTSYACAGVVGNLIVAPPGVPPAHIQMVTVQAQAVGTAPTVAVLINNFSGSFTSVGSGVPDPPELANTGSLSTPTFTQNRYYFKSATSPLPELVQTLQVKLSFPAENFRAEVLGLGIQ